MGGGQLYLSKTIVNLLHPAVKKNFVKLKIYLKDFNQTGDLSNCLPFSLTHLYTEKNIRLLNIY